MKRKRNVIVLLIILAGLFTVLSSVLINLATTQSLSILRLPPTVIWILLGAVTFAGSIVAVFLFHLQTAEDRDKPTPEIRNRQRMLAKVQTFWISGVLEKSLHGAALIELELREQYDTVANPWQLILQEMNQLPSTLPPGTHITQVYDGMNGELLILGEPGSGKTTLLLELARDLLDRARRDDTHPIPVIFNLSSWAVKRQPLTKWLVEELNAKYQVPNKLGQLLVHTDQLLLLLDGLDEVSLDYRETCIDSINNYRREHGLGPLVVCSRSTEYLEQTTLLQLHGAVVVQPLTREQIEEYLTLAGEKLAAVREAFHRDKVLQELATTPLMLSVITLAYQRTSDEIFLVTDSLTTLRKHVFATYVQRMLTRRQIGPHYTFQQSISWLTWLARQLINHNQTEFYLERMQLDWLSRNLSYRLYSGIIVGLLHGFAFGLLYGLFFGLFLKPDLLRGFGCGFLIGILNSFMFVILNGLVFKMFRNPNTKKKPEEVFSHSWENSRQKLIAFLGNRFVYGFIIGLLNGVLIAWLGVRNNFFEGLTGGIVYGVLNALPIGIAYGLLGKLDTEIQPAEIVSWSWDSLRQNWVKSLIAGILSGLIYGVLLGLLYNAMIFEIVLGLAFGMVLVLILLLNSGLSHEMLNEQTFIKPNQGIRSSLRNSVYTGLGGGLVIGIAWGLANAWGAGIHKGLVLALVLALSAGLIFWMRNGGAPCILHTLLRVYLWQTGSAPWNYPRFLEYAVDHILLRRVGGGFIFIHRLLLDYFASLDTVSTLDEEVMQAHYIPSEP